VVADVYSRRLSVLIGLGIIGSGYVVMAVAPSFAGLAAGGVCLGVGYTFISGAHEAWLADEIGEGPAAPIYVRATQASQLMRLAGVPIGVALASIDLRVPLVVGAAGYWALAAFLVVVMPERGYAPLAENRPSAWAAMRTTLRDGIGAARARPEIASMLAIALLFGMSGEGLGRLAPLHFLTTVGLPPHLNEATWFGVLNGGAYLGGAIVATIAGRAAKDGDARRIMGVMLVLTTLMMAATALFAVASSFWLALLGFWVARCMRIAMNPFMIARINQGLAPGIRATVLSMLGQAGAVGEVCSGPTLGLVGSMRGVRSALTVSAGILLPAVALCGHGLRRSAPR
jgi:MFS family permease